MRGTRNYDEIKAIPNFKSIESTHEGLRKLKLLRDERIRWNDPTQLYSDAFYKNWLLLRMENWDKLDFERNIIECSKTLTFAQAKVRVNAALQKIQEKMYMKQSQDFTAEEITKSSEEIIQWTP